MQMTDPETKRKLRELGIGEAIEILDAQQADSAYACMPFEDRFQRVVDYLYQQKHNASTARAIRLARFRYKDADIARTHYEGRGIDRHTLAELATCGFIANSTNIVFQGFTGSGKTWLGCAIGRQACRNGLRVCYIRVPDLLAEREEAIACGKSMAKVLRKYSAYGLLILDEWLMEDLNDDEEHFFFELVERRYNTASTVFCTQYRKGDWHSRLGGGAHADAIMDRIVHNAVWVDTGSMNMREHLAASPQFAPAAV
jgi:DNA replication protein DnaC